MHYLINFFPQESSKCSASIHDQSLDPPLISLGDHKYLVRLWPIFCLFTSKRMIKKPQTLSHVSNISAFWQAWTVFFSSSLPHVYVRTYSAWHHVFTAFTYVQQSIRSKPTERLLALAASSFPSCRLWIKDVFQFYPTTTKKKKKTIFCDLCHTFPVNHICTTFVFLGAFTRGLKVDDWLDLI